MTQGTLQDGQLRITDLPVQFVIPLFICYIRDTANSWFGVSTKVQLSYRLANGEVCVVVCICPASGQISATQNEIDNFVDHLVRAATRDFYLRSLLAALIVGAPTAIIVAWCVTKLWRISIPKKDV